MIGSTHLTRPWYLFSSIFAVTSQKHRNWIDIAFKKGKRREKRRISRRNLIFTQDFVLMISIILVEVERASH